jgi:hypothetical protein
MKAGVVLGIIALVVAIGSLVWSIIAWSIERRDRRADVAEERRRREATAARDRDRFTAEQGDREARGRTEVAAHFWGFRPVAGGRRYQYRLSNLGPAAAREVVYWLEAEDGTPISDREEPGAVRVDQELIVGLTVLSEHLDTRLRGARLMLEWHDVRPQKRVSDAHVFSLGLRPGRVRCRPEPGAPPHASGRRGCVATGE